MCPHNVDPCTLMVHNTPSSCPHNGDSEESCSHCVASVGRNGPQRRWLFRTGINLLPSLYIGSRGLGVYSGIACPAANFVVLAWNSVRSLLLLRAPDEDLLLRTIKKS